MPDESVLGAATYLMAPIEGFNPAVSLARLHSGNEGLRHQMCLEAVGALAPIGAEGLRAVADWAGDQGHTQGFT